jgi:DNA helicase IV
MTKEEKEWIDNADYEELLSKWRFAPVGDPFFQGETGDYYSKKMAEKRYEIGYEGHVRASKSIGWDNR